MRISTIKVVGSIGKLVSLVFMFLCLNGIISGQLYGMELTEIQCSAASVLPYFIDENGEKCVILAQEAGGCDKDTYDDFGGKSERCDRHPAQSAAREFWEEAILNHTIGMSLSDVATYIDQQSNNTETVVAFKTKRAPYHYMVTYITDFAPYVTAFCEKFYNVRFGHKLSHEFREKKSIAIVKWETLKNAISTTSYGDVEVSAKVLYDKGESKDQIIRLRRIFSSKMRLFFQNQEYRPGIMNKIRFYSYDFIKDKECKETNVDEHSF